MTKIPYLRFDTAELPVAERLDRYRAILTHYDVSVPAGTDRDDFEVLAEAWLLGGLVAAADIAAHFDDPDVVGVFDKAIDMLGEAAVGQLNRRG